MKITLIILQIMLYKDLGVQCYIRLFLTSVGITGAPEMVALRVSCLTATTHNITAVKFARKLSVGKMSDNCANIAAIIDC